jgi:xanthine dehydrogenase small subunit
MTPSPVRPIRFVFRGQVVEVPAGDPTRTVLQWLREDARACGTKEGCAEGDCGACTVLVAELAPEPAGTPATPADGAACASRAVQSDGIALRPINACIRFLPTLDGKALLTVEDLAEGSALHPAQQAMLDCHGSQCGFCTPGFVMSLAATHQRHAAAGTRPTRGELADDLAGNLCRCTGYRPILDAGLQMADTPGPGLPLAALRAPLQSLRRDTALSWPGHYHAPRTLADLAALREALPDARLLAGATDVGLWVTKHFRALGELIWLGNVAELRALQVADDSLHIGAAVPLEDAWTALGQHWPGVARMGRRFAGPPVRHAGTLCGNLANGSPIGDSAPVLIALGASLRLRRGSLVRELPLQDFYLDYMKNALQPGEFVEAARVPLSTAGEGWQVQAHKLSKRFDCDISGLSAGFALRLDGERVAELRLAFGGLAGIVQRAAGAEAALLGQPWTEATLDRALAALDSDFTPLSDLRASASYRRQTAAALLRRLWLSTRRVDPLPAEALDVWATPA